MEEKLRKMLEPKRFDHSIGVRDTAIWLAKTYKIDKHKAKVAGLLHDCAKNMECRKMIELCEKAGHEPDEITRIETGLLHAFAGAYVARKEFHVYDPEILGAIYYHTTAVADMTPLMKIIYIADMCEPGRRMPEVSEIRKIAANDLDNAMLFCLDYSINHIVAKGKLIHPNTIEARNFLLKNKKRKERSF